MTSFETYLYNLAKHEQSKSQDLLVSSRNQILVNAGVRLNWMGDFFANPNILWSDVTEMNVDNIQFTGTNPDWNNILIKDCDGNSMKFIRLIDQNQRLKQKFQEESSFNPDLPILVRKSEGSDKFKVFDGMHRFIGALVHGQPTIKVYFPINEDKALPWCEPHVIYDLIRGFLRNANDKEGEKQLYHALRLLIRTYGNTRELLVDRFNKENVDEDTVQEIIKNVLRIDDNNQ
jgi:hypothetical protein